MSGKHADRALRGELPILTTLLKQRRLFLISHRDLSRVKTPSIIFTAHQSLRIGMNLLSDFLSVERNLLVVTYNSYGKEELLKPFFNDKVADWSIRVWCILMSYIGL